LGFIEGPHNSGGGGLSDRAVENNSHDFRFTQRSNVVSAIVMDWPTVEDHFLIHAFNTRTVVASGGIAGVKLLGSRERLEWLLTEDGLWIQLPERRLCETAAAV
jgi:hypothetical protein